MKYTNDKADDWHQYLQSIVFAYRINVQTSTKFSPFELMYGIRAKLPLDLEGKEEVKTDDDETHHDRLLVLASSLKEIRNKAKKNIENAQAKQKFHFDIKHQAPLYKVGDMVLRYNRRRDTRMGDKLAPRYTGPFKVLEVLGRGVYRLEFGNKPINQIVNASNLKLCNNETTSTILPRSTRSTAPLASSPNRPTRVLKRLLSSSPSSSSPNNSSRRARTLNFFPSTQTNSVMWIADLNLNNDDRNIILGNNWLNDKIIDAVNVLIGRHFGENFSQSTLLSQGAGGFDSVKTESVYILYDLAHWITSAYIGGRVMYADSLGHGVSQIIARQLRQLYATQIDSDGRLEVHVVPCQAQPNSNDCGLFASAFAMEWALGGDIQEITYSVSMMRQHLLKCLEIGVIERFPRLKAKTRGRQKKSQIVYV